MLSIAWQWLCGTTHRLYLDQRLAPLSAPVRAQQRFDVVAGRVKPQIVSNEGERLTFALDAPAPSELQLQVVPRREASFEIAIVEGGSRRVLRQGRLSEAAEFSMPLPSHGQLELANEGPLLWSDPRVVRRADVWPALLALLGLLALSGFWGGRLVPVPAAACLPWSAARAGTSARWTTTRAGRTRRATEVQGRDRALRRALRDQPVPGSVRVARGFLAAAGAAAAARGVRGPWQRRRSRALRGHPASFRPRPVHGPGGRTRAALCVPAPLPEPPDALPAAARGLAGMAAHPAVVPRDARAAARAGRRARRPVHPVQGAGLPAAARGVVPAGAAALRSSEVSRRPTADAGAGKPDAEPAGPQLPGARVLRSGGHHLPRPHARAGVDAPHRPQRLLP